MTGALLEDVPASSCDCSRIAGAVRISRAGSAFGSVPADSFDCLHRLLLQGMLTQKLIRKQDYLATVDWSHAGLQDAAAQAADDKAAAASHVSLHFPLFESASGPLLLQDSVIPSAGFLMLP